MMTRLNNTGREDLLIWIFVVIVAIMLMLALYGFLSGAWDKANL